MDWFMQGIDSVANELDVETSKGLNDEEVKFRLGKYGYNDLKEEEKESIFKKIMNQLNDFLVIILIGASIVSASVGETVDAFVIIAIVVINAILGVVQEGKAEKALEALKEMSSPHARAIRNYEITIVEAKELVPGDVILIEAGDIIPADIRLFESFNLKIEEASLTGESVPTEKDAKQKYDKDVSLGDRQNMAFMSTIVTYGRGKGIVTDTGVKTQIGKIAEALQSIDEEKTPLQHKLDELGKWLGIFCLVICAFIFGIGVYRGQDILEMFMVAVSLAVAAIPEGLPAVVTIVLALGMKRMAVRNAIVRRLLAVETLGCVNVICTDKTGTLTQNEMTTVKAYVNEKNYSIIGNGYNPEGEFLINNVAIKASQDSELVFLLTSSLLCNDSVLKEGSEGQGWEIVGDPTEGALVVAAAKSGLLKNDYESKYPRVSEIPFDSERKMMTTFNKNLFEDKVVSFTKGAPDIIINKCSKVLINSEVKDFTLDQRDRINYINGSYAKQALRVLAFAYKEYNDLPNSINPEDIEKDMIFIGLMGMIDPARTEAKEAIKVCKKAGIRPIMITGDYKDTAVAIALDLGLVQNEDSVKTGSDIDGLSDKELQSIAGDIGVYARVSPEHKVRIVEALKNNGHITAMTGDGVNDAMALKKSDIGVSMGITGTDVAKGTADIVLMDDNFATIVSAVEEGRIIYSNIRKFVFFLLSCNVGEILIVFLSILFRLPVPLLPIQLLWLNLITDSFPALALGTENGEPDIMELPPRDTKEPILNGVMVSGIIVQSIALTVSVLIAYIWALRTYNGDLLISRTVALATLILAELVRAHSSRSERYSVFKLGFFSNPTLIWASMLSFLMLVVVLYIPILQSIFKTYAIGLKDWYVIILLCLIPVIAGEISKWIRRMKLV
ncbi:MAG: cation-translocating P-type ATPase [Clostridiales bacterium]|jgi:Ca2+-transporting ATPase|nr:cation-translocating P-type ATPase [Clostridiales bacterium]